MGRERHPRPTASARRSLKHPHRPAHGQQCRPSVRPSPRHGCRCGGPSKAMARYSPRRCCGSRCRCGRGRARRCRPRAPQLACPVGGRSARQRSEQRRRGGIRAHATGGARGQAGRRWCACAGRARGGGVREGRYVARDRLAARVLGLPPAVRPRVLQHHVLAVRQPEAIADRLGDHGRAPVDTAIAVEQARHLQSTGGHGGHAW